MRRARGCTRPSASLWPAPTGMSATSSASGGASASGNGRLLCGPKRPTSRGHSPASGATPDSADAGPVDRTIGEAVAEALERDPVALAEKAEQLATGVGVGITGAGQPHPGAAVAGRIELDHMGDLAEGLEI